MRVYLNTIFEKKTQGICWSDLSTGPTFDVNAADPTFLS